MTSRGTPATAVLARAGIRHELHPYEPAAARGEGHHAYGREAAAALGVDPDRIFKTLVATADGRLVVAVVPVAGELDLKRLAAVLAVRRAELADPAVAERATGYVVGGISPLGQRRALPTIVDAGALEHPTIYVSAGRRGLQVELAPGDLVSLTHARVEAIARVG